jgi:putative transposase
MRLKIRTDGKVINKAIYLALGVNMDGKKEILGMWSQENEGAKFWLNVLTDLQSRGVQDILISCVDGLKGFPEAIESVFPNSDVQTCIVHMIRNSLKYISYKERKSVATDLKLIYKAPTLEVAKEGLSVFKKKWNKSYPAISRMWENNWENIIPFFQYTEDIRKAIYTTNAIESINRSIRKTTKVRGSFPNDESAFKLLYLGLKKASQKWNMPIRNWGQAISQLEIHFEGRVSFN